MVTRHSVRNPLKFKSIECNLLGREKAEGDERRREERGSQTEEDEEED